MSLVVIPFLQGGFVNQLLQIISVFGLCKTYNRPFAINLKYKERNPHSTIDYYDEKTGFFKNVVSLYKTTQEPQTTLWENGKFQIDDWQGRLNSTRNQRVLIKGYLQSDRWFRHVQEELFPLFHWGTPEHVEALRAKYPLLDSSLFLHFRLGDYLHLQLHKIDLTLYYQKCIELFQTKLADTPTKHIYIFSNEPDKVQAMFGATVLAKLNNCPYTIVRNENELDSLYLMSQCKLGGIAANSSYSWFGLYLDPKRPLLCLPNKWFNDQAMQIEGFYFQGSTKVTT
jgi:hypothetical protein